MSLRKTTLLVEIAILIKNPIKPLSKNPETQTLLIKTQLCFMTLLFKNLFLLEIFRGKGLNERYEGERRIENMEKAFFSFVWPDISKWASLFQK